MNIANKVSPKTSNRKNKNPAPTLTAEEQSFIEQYASLLSPWGLPPSAGRVFGYLLLVQVPVSIDQIAAALEMSRVGAWNSAKTLETFGHVKRTGTPGSKRAMYSPSSNFDELFRLQANLIESIGALLQDCATDLANEDAVPALEDRATFYTEYSEHMKKTIDKLNKKRKPR